jgi:multidrug efflux system outer membrane protein
MMRLRYLALVTAASLGTMLLGGCATTHHSPPEVVPSTARIANAADTNAALFDSLARSAQLPVERPAGSAFDTSSTQALAWLDVLRDTTLVSLVRQALQQNRDIRTAVARIAEYRALTGSARGRLFPELDANGSVSSNQITIGGSAPIRYDAWRATADLQWELDFWGRIRGGVVAAQADRAARAADERALVLTVVADVANAYLELLEAREELDVSQRTLTSRQSTLNLARQRFGQGLISELDVRQFEGDVAGAAASVAQYTRATSQQQHALALLTGTAPRDIATTAALDSAVAAIAVPDSVTSTLVLRRPDVASAERDLSAAESRVDVTRATRLPRFTLTGEYGSQSAALSQLFGNGTEIYTAQAGVSVPLFTGGRLSADVAVARARAEQARDHYEQVVLSALREVADALVAVRTGREEQAAVTAQAVALRDAYRLAERRYEGGIASYLEVLDAQRTLFTVELAVSQHRRAYLEAVVRLYRALAGRWDTLH